jgi:histidinol-phosphate aminotransferase
MTPHESRLVSLVETLPVYERAPAPPGTKLRLDANEGVPPELPFTLDALRVAGPELVGRYPDAKPLEAALARRFGLEPAQVFVAAGADEVLDRCCRAFLAAGRTMLVTDPTFEMFEHYAALCRAAVKKVSWPSGTFPREAMRSVIDRDVAVVALVTPNNPTGEVATLPDVRAVAHAASRALVILDHAYVEFADEDLTMAALDMPNVVVVRTFSKAWGMAGCRVGYALGPASIIRSLRAAGSPFPVSAASLAIAQAVLENGSATRDAYVARIRVERDALFTVLACLGAQPSRSQGNFVLAELGARTPAVHAALASDGIMVRMVRRSGAFTGLRIALPGNDSDFALLLASIERALTAVTA